MPSHFDFIFLCEVSFCLLMTTRWLTGC